MSKTLVLIDLSSIFWQAWHATKDLETSTAFESTIYKIHKRVNGDDPVAICIDMKPYLRKKISADYKAQRDAPHPAAVEQLQRVIESLTNDGFPVLGAEGYEADDIIATVVNWCFRGPPDTAGPDDSISIVSSDKDLSQLITHNVTQTSPMNGETYDINAVVEKHGVMPSELGDFLALTGDKADNIPGVPGVGAVTAVTLLKTHGWDDLINLIDCGDPDNMLNPPGVRQKLLANFDNLKKSRELVRLMTDAPIDIESIFKPRVRKEVKEEPMGEGCEAGTDDNIDSNDEPLPAIETPQKSPSTSIVKTNDRSLALEPTSMKSAISLAKDLFDSRLYKFPNAQAVLAAILRGRVLGIDATAALDGFHVIMGKLSMSAQLIIALVLKSGKADYFKCIETTAQLATWKTHRKDDPDPDPTVLSWHIAKADNWIDSKTGKALSSKDNWQHDPAGMLRWRSGCDLGRLVYPDVIAGLYTPDEISNGESDFVEADVEVVK